MVIIASHDEQVFVQGKEALMLIVFFLEYVKVM